MIKKGLLLLLAMTVLMTFVSCGIDYRYSLDEKLHNQIECVWGEDNPSHIIYRGEKYCFVGGADFFRVDSDYFESYEEDVLLSWNGNRYIGYIDEYYSYNSNNPMYIYEDRTHSVFFHKDYNYLEDSFVVGDTNDEIVFEDIFASKQDGFVFDESIQIILRSKQCPRIKIYAEVASINDQWYVTFCGSRHVWKPSDEFMEILLKMELFKN